MHVSDIELNVLTYQIYCLTAKTGVKHPMDMSLKRFQITSRNLWASLSI